MIRKDPVHYFQNDKGCGKVFSITLVDGDGGMIKAKCYNELVDVFFNRIEFGKPCHISQIGLKAMQQRPPLWDIYFLH